jgi:iron complex transport system ATP-binding protein
MMGAALQFDDVTLAYGASESPVVHAATFGAMPGALTAIVGPNGSGKSTLVRALLGLAHVRSGAVRVGDESLLTRPANERAQRVAVMPQRETLAFPMRVRDYVALGRAPWQGLFATASPRDRDAIDAALAQLELEPFADRRTDALSGGEWQRVRLARALAQDAPVLVLDEPTTFLDIAHEMATFEVLSTLARAGRTVVMVSHTLALVARFAQQIVLMHQGRVVAIGAASAVMTARVLEPVYDWPLVVSHDPAVGAPTLVPLRRSR